jgi:hemoglobin-like flavoprotein
MSSVEVFRASLQRCLSKPDFLLDFYGLFMDSSDEVRAKFKDTDLKRQTEVLANSLWVMAIVAESAHGSPAWAGLPQLAEKHDRSHLDIRPELYDRWLDCLLSAARRHDALFNDAVEGDWRRTLSVGIEYMRKRY